MQFIMIFCYNWLLYTQNSFCLQIQKNNLFMSGLIKKC